MLPNPSSFPLEKADLCVKCGLCLPHCPTYGLTRNEAESPRGRIALMQGLANHTLESSSALEQHLDGCLGCRACESVCPAEVPYGELIDAGRAQLQAQKPRRNRGLGRMAAWLTNPGRRRWLARVLWLYQRSGMPWLARRFTALSRLSHMLPGDIDSPPDAGTYPAVTTARGQVQLFTGCVSELIEGTVLNDAIAVLNHCGFDVRLSANQGCCGAIHLHNGLEAQATSLFAENLAKFDPTLPVLGTATGCTAMLVEYDRYLCTPEARTFSAQVRDINRFLLDHWPDQRPLSPLKARVMVQEPCTQRHVLGNNAVPDLLRKIPDLEVQLHPGNAFCCGAAGSMMLTHAEQADRLAQTKLEAIVQTAPDYLVSNNIGCAMHLRSTLQRHGVSAKVIHPISLMARQLRGVNGG